ncbi:hypothetical protein [Streptomyces sp. NPDC096153]|uniref:hypothetical protein n=1 Tax=Streptomyces sp. NPDC096153 TaxID=3155548 RepID=UPI00331B5703
MRSAAALALASALLALAAAPASAVAPERATPARAHPAFLEPRDLPPHPSSPWTAGPVTAGVPDPLPFCVGEALPASIARHRVFRTELDAGASQVVVVERDAARARSLVSLWHKAVRSCAARVERQDPRTPAEGRDYGRVPVEDGARLYGVHTAHDFGATDVHLFAMGRDGRTVTVVTWGSMGDFDDAPVAAFRRTARTAVDKLG